MTIVNGHYRFAVTFLDHLTVLTSRPATLFTSHHLTFPTSHPLPHNPTSHHSTSHSHTTLPHTLTPLYLKLSHHSTSIMPLIIYESLSALNFNKHSFQSFLQLPRKLYCLQCYPFYSILLHQSLCLCAQVLYPEVRIFMR